jgi:hypothetical protein
MKDVFTVLMCLDAIKADEGGASSWASAAEHGSSRGGG